MRTHASSLVSLGCVALRMRNGWAVYGLMLAMAGAAHAAELTAAQQKMLSDAGAALKQIEANIKLAEESAGPVGKQATGAKAKLAMTRLGSAKQALPQVEQRLAQLPADHADVQAVQQQFDAAAAAIAQMEQRLTGKSGAAAEAATGGVKLDYRQEEQLKNARFHVNEVEGKAAALADLVEKVKAAPDTKLFDHRIVQQGMNTLEDVDRKIGNARTHLEGLPADGQGVKEVADGLAQAVASIEASRTALTPVHAQLMALIDPAQYPALRADIERLRELGSMYANPDVLIMNREQAGTLLREGPAATAERDRLAAAYAVIMHQQTPDGVLLTGASQHFTEQFAKFSAAAEEQKTALPEQIRADLAEAKRLAEQAVAEKKPAFFGGGVPQQMAFAEDKLGLYAVLDAPGAKALAAELAQTQADLKKTQDALRNDIIASNELPPDRYNGADRDAVTKLATDAWTKLKPDAKVLAVRIPSEQWRRETLWRFQTDSWRKVDQSKLQVQLIVQHDDKLAEIQPINLWQDHLSGDSLSASPLHGKDEVLEPHSLLPLVKVK